MLRLVLSLGGLLGYSCLRQSIKESEELGVSSVTERLLSMHRPEAPTPALGKTKKGCRDRNRLGVSGRLVSVALSVDRLVPQDTDENGWWEQGEKLVLYPF